ncbi:MAG: acyl-CoA dehydrogenase family protein [Candidatus Rokubacteria bacterium]|nr:acyl-CoA dehydrogenase family protein [Candidatus Rokubacteria bacterium]
MDFDLSEEHRGVRAMAREFARKRIAPAARELERAEAFPRELVREMGELGMFGAAFPPAYGGTGLGYLAHMLIAEEVSAAHAALGTLFNMQGMTVPHTILLAGTEAQKERYIPRLIAGEWLGCYGLTEPNAGTDTAAMQTTARRDGTDYVLNGTKCWITQAPVFDAGVVFAKTDPSQRHTGTSAFIVERRSAGLATRETRHKFGYRASPTGELVFEECRVPAANLLGAEGGGFKVMARGIQYGRVCVAARSVGIAQAALDEMVRYANEREQFGRRIGEFQMVQDPIATTAVAVRTARLLTWEAAWRLDQGRPASLEASMAKYHAGEVAFRAAESAVRILGAYSYTDEYPVSRYLADSIVGLVGEGTNNIQKVIVAEDALGWKPANRR